MASKRRIRRNKCEGKVRHGWKRRRTALAAARRCRKWGVAKYPSQVHALKGEVAQHELFDEVPA